MKICLLGDSKRHEAFSNLLKERKVNYLRYYRYNDIPDTVDTDVLVFPIPTMKNGRLNIDGSPSGLLPEDIIRRTQRKVLAVTCNYSIDSSNFCDLSARDDFAYLNAVPTAEGAVRLAINCSDKSISEQKIMITGFGRVGKILADRLRGLGCDVTVSARSLKDLYYAKALNLRILPLSGMPEYAAGFDLVFQTIPTEVLNEKRLQSFGKQCKIIELSSAMRGTDLNYAKAKGIEVIDGTGLPEKTAPVTAGKIWAETVLRIIKEGGNADE